LFKLKFNHFFNRFVANFLIEETIVSETTVNITVADKEFKLKGTEIIKAGFYAYEPKKFDNQLPNLVENEEFEVNFLAIEKETEPPKKVTESELGSYLEHPFKKEIKTHPATTALSKCAFGQSTCQQKLYPFISLIG